MTEAARIFPVSERTHRSDCLYARTITVISDAVHVNL